MMRTAAANRAGARIGFLVLALLAASCGTRVDREAYLASRQVVITDGKTGSASATDGSGGLGSDAATVDGSGSIASGGGSTSNGNGSSTPKAASSDGKTAAVPAGVSSQDVGKTIRIGMHIPQTGAAPLPTDFMDALKVIQQHLNDQGPANGRTYEFLVEDDGYDPAKGLAACRKLADGNVLMVIGHSQPAVQDACAGLFNDRKIPYMMRGSASSILKDRPLAWMGTITDDIQGGLMADYAMHNLGAKDRKGAILFGNDQVEARDSFSARYKAGGGQIVATEEIVPRQADFGATIEKLKQAGAQIVFLSLPPVDVIKLSVQAQGQGYHPIWLGGGTYWNYNLVLESAGAALDGAVSFSPWPSIDSAAAAEWRDIYKKYRPGKDPQDVGMVMWGWASVVKAIVDKAGADLSRASVVTGVSGLQLNSPVWNPLSFGPNRHAGSQQVTVFSADGQAKRWRQITGFAGSF